MKRKGQSVAKYFFCFNPWKGFKAIETAALDEGLQPLISFNPWKGFKAIETRISKKYGENLERFNPWKGFKAIETVRALSAFEPTDVSEFQSLEGIQGH